MWSSFMMQWTDDGWRNTEWFSLYTHMASFFFLRIHTITACVSRSMTLVEECTTDALPNNHLAMITPQPDCLSLLPVSSV
jgi:hypothetical protein